MSLRLAIAVAVFGIGAIALGWVYESHLKTKVASVDLVIPTDIDYFLTHFKYRSINIDGELDYEISSPRLEHRPSNDISHIDSPSVQIYRDNDHWQIDSELGQLQHRDNLLRLEQNVVLQKRADASFRLTTNSILFELDRDLITMESKVLMQSRNAQIEAQHAIFDLANKVYTLQNAHAVYNQ